MALRGHLTKYGCVWRVDHLGSRKLLSRPHNPTACNSQTQTTTTTNTFRIDLMLEAMGM